MKNDRDMMEYRVLGTKYQGRRVVGRACWCDYGVVEARSEEEAVTLAVGKPWAMRAQGRWLVIVGERPRLALDLCVIHRGEARL